MNKARTLIAVAAGMAAIPLLGQLSRSYAQSAEPQQEGRYVVIPSSAEPAEQKRIIAETIERVARDREHNAQSAIEWAQDVLSLAKPSIPEKFSMTRVVSIPAQRERAEFSIRGDAGIYLGCGAERNKQGRLVTSGFNEIVLPIFGSYGPQFEPRTNPVLYLFSTDDSMSASLKMLPAVSVAGYINNTTTGAGNVEILNTSVYAHEVWSKTGRAIVSQEPDTTVHSDKSFIDHKFLEDQFARSTVICQSTIDQLNRAGTINLVGGRPLKVTEFTHENSPTSLKQKARISNYMRSLTINGMDVP